MSFVAYPAIDVRDGRVVRLRQGDYAAQTDYPDSPLQVALGYAAQGARWLHLVDLDAARTGGDQALNAGATLTAGTLTGSGNLNIIGPKLS